MIERDEYFWYPHVVIPASIERVGYFAFSLVSSALQ
jgi:hypothetical protein